MSSATANHWHTDVTFVDRPPAFTLLHGVVIPPVGGDTIWANTATAYQSLPDELRDLAGRLRIVHTNDHDYAAVYGRGERVDPATEAAHQQFLSTVYETEHPAVRLHPETAERRPGAGRRGRPSERVAEGRRVAVLHRRRPALTRTIPRGKTGL
jgi:alpha-ketoglutarate-dependent taurine dioxygenase